MGRELRRVPKDWQHPKSPAGHYVPLHGRDFYAEAEKWDEENALWKAGTHPSQVEYGRDCKDYAEYAGPRPAPDDYMLAGVSESERTHYQLYETTTEGTPISPVFETFDELVKWAAQNATTFARFKASEEEWREMLTSGFVHHQQGNLIFM